MSKRLFSQTKLEEQDNLDNTKAAIPLSKSRPDLVNGIPLSGEDYLLVVRQQARQCAKTVVAPPPKKTKKIELPPHFQILADSESNTQCQASDAWRKGFTEPFKTYQKQMQKSKKPTHKHKEITSIDEAYKLLYKTDNQDLMTLIPTLSQHSILKLLHFHCQWLQNNTDIELKCQWIFGLLVFLDPVLTSKNVSILRDLSRECIKIRPSLPAHIAPLNIIITIISDTFGQADLA